MLALVTSWINSQSEAKPSPTSAFRSTTAISVKVKRRLRPALSCCRKGGLAVASYFLKIDGVAGESLDAKHKGEIELESFSWGESQQGAAAASGGAGAGKGQMHDFHFAMRMNKASPQLLLACASGQHLKSAILTRRRTRMGQQEFLASKFVDVL